MNHHSIAYHSYQFIYSTECLFYSYHPLYIYRYYRVVESNDSATLLTMLDDVTHGDISQEESDPKLYAAIQLAQYASQYLLSCRKVMKDREQVLRSALDTFQEEDDVLELKLTKLRLIYDAYRHSTDDDLIRMINIFIQFISSVVDDYSV